MVKPEIAKNKEVEATIAVIKAVADVIRELGSIPSGHLYARLMGHLNIDQYNTIIVKLAVVTMIRCNYCGVNNIDLLGRKCHQKWR